MRHHLTSSLNEAKNDTGRDAYCGPMVLSAITGWSVSKIEAAIRAYRGDHDAAQKIIEGTTTEDVAAALAVFGYELEQIEDYWHLEKRERPTLWQWMQKPRSAWRHYVLAVHKGREGHWICIKGCKLCDTYTDGRWVFVSDGPHKGARIMEVYVVKRAAKHATNKMPAEQWGPSRRSARRVAVGGGNVVIER